MTEAPIVARRPSGRDARRAERAGPLPDHLRPVRPGMTSGRYRPLSDSDVEQIHQTALRLLAEVGLGDATETGIEIMTQAGCTLSLAGPIAVSTLAGRGHARQGRSEFCACTARTAKHDLEPWGKRAYFGTAGAAVNIVDPRKGYRDSTIQDLYDIGRIVDVMDHIHFFQRAVVPRDIPDPYEMDFNTCYASVMSTTKHVGSSWVHPDHLVKSLEMLHVMAGSEQKWRERPFVSQSNCFVVPPMKFAADACRCLEVGRSRRDAGAAAVGRAGRRDGAGGAGRCPGPGSGRGARRTRVRQRDQARRIRRYLAPGASSRICAPVRCRAAARSRLCCHRPPARWPISTS